MLDKQQFGLACLILGGVCVGMCASFIISARYVAEPIMPDHIRKSVSRELGLINTETGGMLGKQDFSKNKWLSNTHNQWFYNLDSVERSVIEFHDVYVKWILWLAGIALFMIAAGAILRIREEPPEDTYVNLMRHTTGDPFWSRPPRTTYSRPGVSRQSTTPPKPKNDQDKDGASGRGPEGGEGGT